MIGWCYHQWRVQNDLNLRSRVKGPICTVMLVSISCEKCWWSELSCTARKSWILKSLVKCHSFDLAWQHGVLQSDMKTIFKSWGQNCAVRLETSRSNLILNSQQKFNYAWGTLNFHHWQCCEDEYCNVSVIFCCTDGSNLWLNGLDAIFIKSHIAGHA